MFGKLFNVVTAPIRDIAAAVVDPFGEDEPLGTIPPIIRAIDPSASIANAILEEAGKD